MGCWLKKYRNGYRWQCNTTNKWISPTMEWKVGLLANTLGERMEGFTSEKDARLVTDWKVAKKEAVKMLKTLSTEEYETKIKDWYGSLYNEDTAW